MLNIRLSRFGKKKQPTYRLIVLEKSKDPWGNYLENLGFYNPRTVPPTIKLKPERIKHWLSQGAEPSPTVHNILVDQKIIEAPKAKVKIKQKKKEKISQPAKKEKTEQLTEKPKEEPKHHP